MSNSKYRPAIKEIGMGSKTDSMNWVMVKTHRGIANGSGISRGCDKKLVIKLEVVATVMN
jgi:hypothetical protein